MKRSSVFIIPISVIIAVSIFYFTFMSSFAGYGPSNARFINVLELYDSLPEASTLFLGDSQVRENIDCNVLECYNLGISGILPMQVALQSESIIRSNPETVYLGLSPLYFSEDLNVNDDIYLFIGERQTVTDPYLMQELTQGERELIGANRFDAALYKRKFILPHYLGLVKGTFTQSDTRLSTDNFKDPWQLEVQTEESLIEKVNDARLMNAFDFSVGSRRQKDTFEYLVKTLSSGDATVVLVRMPLNPLMRDTVNTDDFDSYTETLERRYGVKVEDFTWSFEKDQFVDLTHLNAVGRVILSQELRGGSDTIQ